MSISCFTMAALAVSALPSLKISSATDGSYSPLYYEAVLQADDGQQLLARIPRSADNEIILDRLVNNLQALTAGIRSRLPFTVPEVLNYQTVKTSGRTTTLLIIDYLPGYQLSEITLTAESTASIGGAIAAIHNLPPALLSGAKTAEDCQRKAAELIQQASATRLLPQTLQERWQDLLSDREMWQFSPVVVKGSFSPDSFCFETDESGSSHVSAITGWEELSIGDPAEDLHWLNELSAAAADGVLTAYEALSTGRPDQRRLDRVRLYAELETAKALLRALRDEQSEMLEKIIAVLDQIAQSPSKKAHTARTPQEAVDDVNLLLARTANLPHSQADALAEPAALAGNIYSQEATYADENAAYADEASYEATGSPYAAAPSYSDESSDGSNISASSSDFSPSSEAE